eukprot:TRINITY_DN5309_c0_g3_i1.p1 TRINITY_DN5309_c0_g3~~TRINITY_DN5309_c0_g3_i1.p1  ORF type:complete len:505 (+),score=107.81 TRINITY_DN5309_c0_g3_i1:33-1547(+)
MPLGSLLEKGKAAIKDKVDSIDEKLNFDDVSERVKEKKTELVAQAEELGKHAIAKIESELKEVLAAIEEWVEKTKREAEEWLKEKREELEAWFKEIKEKLHLWALERVEELLDTGLDKLLPKIKSAAKDKYMPRVLQNCVDRVIDAFWFDTKEEVIEIVLGRFRPPIQTEDNESDVTCCAPLIARLRYGLYPYDKTVWQSFRDPVFVVFKLLSLVPVPGLLQVLWFFVFLIIDKEDEFQLLQYILSFKSMQFITMGVIKVIIGSALFFSCITKLPPNCDAVWGSSRPEAIGLILLMCHMVVVWIAFYLLKGSKKKGSYHALLKADHERRGFKAMEEGVYMASTTEARMNRRKTESEYPYLGHRTMKWLLYDMVVFLLCLVLGLVSMFGHANSKARITSSDREGGIISNWRFTATLYWLQTLYGLFAFPFFVFSIPVLKTVFTHAKPTAYKQNGKCVPYIGTTEEARDARIEYLKGLSKENAEEEDEGELEQSAREAMNKKIKFE